MLSAPHYDAPPITVPMHNLTRYLRAQIAVVDRLVTWELPRTLLGLVPIGHRHVTVPVADVKSLAVGRNLRPLRLTVGLGAVVGPWFFLPWWASLPLLVIGLWIVLVALGPQLVLVTRSGRKHRAEVCFGHQLDAELYIEVVEDLASEG